MKPVVRFHFDPVSPYAWLAGTQLGALDAAAEIDARPVLFAGLLNAHGTQGPAEIPVKRAYTMRDVMRCAQALAVPFKGPPTHPFNPLRALRACCALDDAGARRRFGLALMDAAWARGLDLADAGVVAAVADECGLAGAALVEQGGTPEGKQRLIDATQAAAAAGVFGVPSFVVDGEIFWGVDRIDALRRRLRGERIDEDELARLLARPASASR